MQDAFNRNIDYLRVSVTDRCNLRCIYCMPEKGVEWVEHEEMLRFEETLRICALMAELGIRKIKVTGGEPLVRRGIVPFAAELKKIAGIEKVSMTTNALVLDQYLDALLEAGLDAVNISLDTLNGDTFKKIARNDGFTDVLKAILRVKETRLSVKINCVPLRGFNENDIIPLAMLAKDSDIQVRYIEFMPLGYAGELPPIMQEEVVNILKKEFGELTPHNERLGNGPAVYFTVKGFKGKIGFISALSHVFCESCNRLRLTCTGLLKPCLSSDLNINLKQIIRMGGDDKQIKDAILSIVEKKPERHTFVTSGHKTKQMFKIGG